MPLTFTTNVANTVLNAMAIHKLLEMIAENLKCCVKHVDEMKRNGVLHPFHFIQSTMDNCCYYGDPELQRLFISLHVTSLQKADGYREYTALYQFPCFTSLKETYMFLFFLFYVFELASRTVGVRNNDNSDDIASCDYSCLPALPRTIECSARVL